MAIKQSTIQTIQQSGHLIHQACLAIRQDMQIGSLSMVSLINDQPLGADADRAFSKLRSVAKLAHELEAIEEQLKRIYSDASLLIEPEMPVLVSLPSLQAQAQSATNRSHADVQDVQSRDRVDDPQDGAATVNLRGNALALLQYLKTKLNRRSWTAVTAAEISEATGLARGSVGGAVAKLVDNGFVLQGGRGKFKLP